MSRCKCTGEDSRGGIGLVGMISFSLKNISSLNLFIDIFFPFLSVNSVVEIHCQTLSKAVNCHV